MKRLVRRPTGGKVPVVAAPQHEDTQAEEEEKAEDPDTHISDDTPVRRSFLGRFWSNMSFIKYIILILILPPILNFAALQREFTALAPKGGDRVHVGWGQKMFIHCEGAGIPTVILDAPTGVSSDIWIFLHKELSQYTKVCIYDRSGIGSSDAIFSNVSPSEIESDAREFVSQPSSVEQMMSDFHHLVTEAKPLLRPFILVGSEVGALISRMYALMNPEDVVSIVLVDPLVETLLVDGSEWRDYWYNKLLPSYESLHLSAMLGLSRIALLTGWFQPFYFKEGVPDDVLHRQKSLLCNPRHINSVFHEHLYMNLSFNQINSVWLFEHFSNRISVNVISRKYPSEFPPHLHEEWKKSQKYLVEKLHPGCSSTVLDDTEFLKLYSSSSHIVSSVKSEIFKYRQKNLSQSAK